MLVDSFQRLYIFKLNLTILPQIDQNTTIKPVRQTPGWKISVIGLGLLGSSIVMHCLFSLNWVATWYAYATRNFDTPV